MLYIPIHNESLLSRRMVNRLPLKLGVCFVMYYIFVQIHYYGKTRDGHLKTQPSGGHDIVSSSLVKLPNNCNGGDSNLPKPTLFKQVLNMRSPIIQCALETCLT